MRHALEGYLRVMGDPHVKVLETLTGWGGFGLDSGRIVHEAIHTEDRTTAPAQGQTRHAMNQDR